MINDLLRRDDNFPKVGIKLLNGFNPTEDGVYRLNVKDKPYQLFLEFLIEELDHLPFENEVGKTILMRQDSRSVVSDLSHNLKCQLARLINGDGWDTRMGLLENYFDDSLEVFKNEIYPGMNRCGIGYNLDLGNMYLLPITPFFVLERYFVDARDTNPKQFTIQKNGRMSLRFLDGRIGLDFSEEVPGGIHLR